MHGVNYRNYQAAFEKMRGKKEGLIPASELLEKESVSIRQPHPETLKRKTTKEQLREVGDLTRAASGFMFAVCVCGLRVKVPPNFKKPKLTCPRCKRDIDIPVEALAAMTVMTGTATAAAGGQDVTGKVSVHLYQVSFVKALESICLAGGFNYQKQGDVYFIFRPQKRLDPTASSMEMRIFKLEFADMDKIQEVLTALPDMRMIKIHEPSKTIVVEDTPENIAKVESLVRFWDTRPKQVMIEAKILENRGDERVFELWEQVLTITRPESLAYKKAQLKLKEYE